MIEGFLVISICEVLQEKSKADLVNLRNVYGNSYLRNVFLQEVMAGLSRTTTIPPPPVVLQSRRRFGLSPTKKQLRPLGLRWVVTLAQEEQEM